jgi:site-specific DNA recombinase
MEKKQRAAIYCRVSTEMQDKEEGGSLPTQEDRCREWCKFQKVTIQKIYKDVASGSTMERPGLQELFRDAQEGKFNLIVVTKVDRFSRSIMDFLNKNEELIEWGVEFYPVDQALFSTKGPEGNLMRNILLAFAEFEREMTRKRTREGIRARRQRGEWHGGTPPYGFKVVDKKLIAAKDEVLIVKRVFKEYTQGKSSVDIAQLLSSEGLRTRKGGNWTKQAVLRIIQNPVHMGKLADPDNPKTFIDGVHKAIIDEDTFAKAASLNEAARMDHFVNKILPNESLFASLMKCGHCDRNMTAYRVKKKGRTNSYYRCQTSMKRGAANCPVGQISSVNIEAIGITLLRLLSQEPELLKSVLEKSSSDTRAEIDALKENKSSIEKRISEMSKRIQNLVKTLENPKAEDMQDSLLTRINQLQSEVKDMQGRTSAIEVQILQMKQPIDSQQQLSDSYNGFWTLWKDLDTFGRKSAIRSVVKEIRVFSETETRFRIEIELLTGLKTKASTVSSGGSGDKVRTLVTLSTPARTRTSNLLIKSQLLYQLSYRGGIC